MEIEDGKMDMYPYPQVHVHTTHNRAGSATEMNLVTVKSFKKSKGIHC